MTFLSKRRTPAHPSRLPFILALEPRFMFDAAGIATAADVAAEAATDSAAPEAAAPAPDPAAEALARALAGHVPPAAGSESDPATGGEGQNAAPAEDWQVLREADPGRNSYRKEVAFIDTSVADYRTLVDGVRPGVEVVLLDGTGDGLAQMAAWAAGKSGYDAVHVLSHGETGRLYFGSATLDNSTVKDRNGDLGALGRALTEDGGIFLYACDVASDAEGQAFIDDLASRTGAVVLASTDATGAGALGGDWDLEASSDQGTRDAIEAFTLSFEGSGFDHLMAITTGTIASSNVDFTGSSIARASNGDVYYALSLSRQGRFCKSSVLADRGMVVWAGGIGRGGWPGCWTLRRGSEPRSSASSIWRRCAGRAATPVRTAVDARGGG